MRDILRTLISAFAASEGEERTGFEFVWVILLLSGSGIVLTLAVRLLFIETI